MAVVGRRRRLVNPAHRRGKRRLTLLQKLHFGSKRQRAAAKLRLSGKRTRRNLGTLRTYKRRPKTGFKAAGIKWGRIGYKRARPRRKNFGSILSFTVNPGRRRKTIRKGEWVMAKTRKRRRAKARVRRHRITRRRRTNLFGFGKKRRSYRRRRHVVAVRHNRRRRHNPRRRRNVGLPRVGGFVTKAAWTIAGAVGTRFLTQWALGSKNSGILGYVGNAAAALGLGWGVGKVMKSKDAATWVTVGGFVGIVMRVLQEYTPIGSLVASQLSGLGDYGLGVYMPTSFFVPLVAGSDGATMQMPSAVGAMIAAAGARKGVSGLATGRYGARAGRYA